MESISFCREMDQHTFNQAGSNENDCLSHFSALKEEFLVSTFSLIISH